MVPATILAENRVPSEPIPERSELSRKTTREELSEDEQKGKNLESTPETNGAEARKRGRFSRVYKETSYDAIPGPLGLASASLEGKVALVTGAGMIFHQFLYYALFLFSMNRINDCEVSIVNILSPAFLLLNRPRNRTRNGT